MSSRPAGPVPVVAFEGVSKVYGRVRAVDGLSLELRRGETVALLGRNGAGKSTSLDMLLALRKPTSGRIRMYGSDPYHAVKSGRVGAMLQSGGLMPEVTVRELVTLVSGFHPRPLPVDQTLRRAGIADIADRRVDKLSGGQTQRVRFALAIAGESDLIVLDEPTTAMDVETRQAFCADMNAEGADGCTLLFATRYLEEADQAADRILVLNQGRLLAEGTPAQIKARAGAKRISFRLDHIDQPDPRFYGGVHLTAWKWLAIAGIIWLGALTFAALAVAIGYRFAPEHGPARRHAGVLRHVDPGRPVVRAGGLDADNRAGTAHLPDHQDRHRPDQRRHRARDLHPGSSWPGSPRSPSSQCSLCAVPPRRYEPAPRIVADKIGQGSS